MEYVFRSVLADEINDYLRLTIGSGRCVEKIKSRLKSLDMYLIKHSLVEKTLTEDLVSSWLDEKDIKPQTKAGMLTNIKGFAKYLISIGHLVSLPDPPLLHQDYIPYIFSSEELVNIFHEADNHQVHSRSVPSDIQFPILLRVLYGCGLRLREAITITWKEIDLKNGVIMIHKAKNQKQRMVPISESLKIILKLYQKSMFSNGSCLEYVFESHRNPSNPYNSCTFENWFSKILCNANINYIRNSKHERGPCPHCLRHLVDSQIKVAENLGIFSD